MTVFRIQDRDGRGPWRPGLSLQWVDADAPAGRLVETVFDLIPLSLLRTLVRDTSLHYGCACRTLAELMAWLTPVERARLAILGFHPVQLRVDLVIAESPWQLVVGRVRPFADGATRRAWPCELNAALKTEAQP